MAADDADGAFASAIGEFDDLTAISQGRSSGLERVMAGIDEGLVMMRLGRMRASREQSERNHFFDRDADGKGTVDFHVFELGDLIVFGEGPEFFEDFVKLLVIGHGKDFARRDFAMMKFDAAVGEASDDGIMRDHHYSPALLMQLAQESKDYFFIDGVEIAGGLVGQNDFRIIDQGPGDTNALLLST